MLRLCLALVAATQLGRPAPAPPEPAGALCLEHVCFGVAWGRQRFAAARGLCEARGGQLLTVRSTVAENAIALLARNRSDARLWIGLQLPPGQCWEPARPLRGFRWVTGDERTDYTRWGPGDAGCGPQCVAVAALNLTWEAKRCDSEADGFLCEYNYPGTCPKLSPGPGLEVTYTTPFGAQGSDLLALPPQTTAWAPALGLELVCQEEEGGGGLRWSSARPGAWPCQLGNGGCEDSCQGDGGTPRCTCPPGKRLARDQRSCVSLCADAPCEHHCIPLAANFTCMCHQGYELAGDGISCGDIDDCRTTPAVCDQVCINTEGGFLCQCHTGYELVEGRCEDVIDCYEEKCHHQCEDVPGGYRCSCFSGYAPSPHDPHKCALFCNQTECPADCDPHTQDTCYCPDGFLLDHHNGSAKMCVDIDECEQGICDQNCTNEPGGYKCACWSGYILSPEDTCISEDEFSGETELYPKTTAPTRVPPTADSLHPGVLIGISIGILATILVLMAILYYLMKKHFPIHGAMDYKCSKRTEKEVVLQQVTPGCPSANQKL